MPEQNNSNEAWTGRDTAAVILVGLFWIVGIIVVLTSKHIPKEKRRKIAGYGTLAAVGVYILASVMVN